jgi:hypothetical protein
MTMLFLLLLMLVAPATIGFLAAFGMYCYRLRQAPSPFLPRWVSTTSDSPVPVVVESKSSPEEARTDEPPLFYEV